VVDETRLAQATDVPQFFGPNRDGVVTGANLSHDWKTSPPRELWRQPVGAGWSAYAVVKGRAYTQEQRGDDELVTCYDLFTGKLLWEHADKTCFNQWQSGTGPHATPTVDTGRVYTYGATGLLNCLDAATGQRIWQRSVLAENKLPNLEWGASASPLLADDKVVVSGGNAPGPTLLAYQRDTGAPLWKSGNDAASYASPILATLAGKRVILSNNTRGFNATDPATGAVLLDCPWGNDKRPKASQPVVVPPDRVFVSAGYGLGCHLYQIKAESDVKFIATELWHTLRMKTQFNSPAVRDGHAYGLDDGRLACLDFANGERLWKEGSFGSGQTLLVDDLILVQGESGAVTLACAKPEGYEELGRIEALSSKTWNNPTLAGRYLLVRNDREAVCYELPISKASVVK
jgi:outer membrane protein assembly factor BamB